MRARKNQVSIPNPEFGMDFDASARAMHQSASMGSPMVHGKATSMPAAVEKFLAATMYERNTMFKTLKRKIALVAVAGLGLGVLSTVPAFAGITAAATGVKAPSGDGSSKYAILVKNASNTATSIAVYLGSTPVLNLSATGDTAGDNTAVTLTGGGNLTATVVAGVVQTSATTVTITAGNGTVTGNASFTPSATTATAVALTGGTTATITNLTAITGSIVAVNAGPLRAGSNQTTDLKWSATTGQIQPATTAPMRITPLASPSGANVTFVAATGSKTLSDSGGTTVGTVQVDKEGNYTLLSFWDMNDNTTAENTEPQVIYSFTTSGAATQFDLQAGQSAAAGSAKEFSIAMRTATGALTQAIANEFVSISAVAPTGVVTLSNGAGSSSTGNATTLVANTTGAAGTASTAYIAYSDFADGYAGFKVANNVAGESVTITVTPSATLISAGAAAKTTTLTTVGANTSTTMKATLALNSLTIVDTANTTATLNAYTASLDVTTFVFNVTGLTPSSSYTVDITLNANAGNRTATVNGSSYTLTLGDANNAGPDLVRTSDASGNDTLTLVFSGALADAERFIVDLDAGNNGTQTNARVTANSLTYTNKITAPAAFPSISISGTPITLSGTVADQFSNPVGGVTVTATGSVTPAGTSLTGTVVTGSDGKWSITVTPIAATTKVTFAVVSARSGLTIADLTSKEVNITAGGNPTSGSVTTSPATTSTTIPAIVVPYTGRASGATDELYTLATATAAGTLDGTGVDANTETCITVTPSTSPASNIVITGSAGVLFYSATCGNTAAHDLSAGKTTLTVASGTAIYATSTKVGENTITMVSGTVTTTQKFWAVNSIGTANRGVASRNIDLTGPASLDTAGISTVKVKVTDAFGNPVQIKAQAAADPASPTISVSVSGNALLSGNSTTFSVTSTNSAGEATVAIIGLSTAGDAVITAASTDITNAQFTAAAGSANSTTAGTNGLTASVATKSVTIPVKAGAAATAANTATDTAIGAVKTDVTSVKADVKAVSDTVATLSKAVATIQSSVTELTSTFAAQIKSLTDAIAKISAAIAALSKKISAPTKKK